MPPWDPRLAKSTTVHHLQVALVVGAVSSIKVNTSTAAMPASGTVQIGSELIQYRGGSTRPPFMLTGITRGMSLRAFYFEVEVRER